MSSNGKRMVNEDLIKKLENLPEGLEVVEANSTDEATETLSKLTVGDTVYSVPQGTTYTAGTGIDITNNEVSVANTVAMKTDIPHLYNIYFSNSDENSFVFFKCYNTNNFMLSLDDILINIPTSTYEPGDEQYQYVDNFYKLCSDSNNIRNRTLYLYNNDGSVYGYIYIYNYQYDGDFIIDFYKTQNNVNTIQSSAKFTKSGNVYTMELLGAYTDYWYIQSSQIF